MLGLRRLLCMFGVKVFRVGDVVKPDYRIFKTSYLFEEGKLYAKIRHIENGRIYLDDYNGFWSKRELEF